MTASRGTMRSPDRLRRFATHALACALYLAVGVGAVAAQATDARTLYRDGRAMLDRAVARYDADEIFEASTVLRRAVEINASFGEAWLALAEAAYWLGDAEAATDALGRAQSLRVRGSAAEILAARIAVLAGDYAGARALFERVLQREPYNDDARVGVALLNLAGGATSAADRSLRASLDRLPGNRQLLIALVDVTTRLGDQRSARSFMEEAVRLHPGSASIQLRAARFYLESGDSERAAVFARNAVTLAPEWSEAWLVLATIARVTEDLERARAHVEQIIRLEPENHRAWYTLGYLAHQAGDTRGALRSYDRARTLRPDYELAQIASEQLIASATPLEDEARIALGERYLARGAALESRFLSRQAERSYRRGLQLSPFDLNLREALADLYLQRGYRARYLQELELIETLDEAENRDRADRITSYRDVLAATPAMRWEVDQFTAQRERTRIAIIYAQSDATLEPGAATVIAGAIASAMATSENVVVADVAPARGTLATQVADARTAGAGLLVAIRVHHDEERVDVTVTAWEPGRSAPLLSRRVVRDGIDRVDSVVRDVTESLLAVVEPVGRVVARRFDRALVSLGRVDGVEVEMVLEITRAGSGVIATAEVLAVDDLVSEVRLIPEGPDRVVVGTTVRIAADAAEDDAQPPGSEPEAAPTGDALEPQRAPLGDLIVNLFQIR